MSMIPRTRDFSVKFGRQPDMGLEGQKAFPFIYTFINHNDDAWAPHSPGFITYQTDAIDNIVKGIGPLVPAGGKVTQNVILDPDYAFKLLTIRYTALYYRHALQLNDQYMWYFNQNIIPGAPFPPPSPAGLSEGMDQDMDWVGTSAHKHISMSLSFQGSGSQMIYGGDDPGPLGNGRLPIPVDTLEGYPDCGVLSVRTPRLLPLQCTLVFEITNNLPAYPDPLSQDIVVGALIYGMKVRL
jgi:hypothetical protein